MWPGSEIAPSTQEEPTPNLPEPTRNPFPFWESACNHTNLGPFHPKKRPFCLKNSPFLIVFVRSHPNKPPNSVRRQPELLPKSVRLHRDILRKIDSSCSRPSFFPLSSAPGRRFLPGQKSLRPSRCNSLNFHSLSGHIPAFSPHLSTPAAPFAAPRSPFAPPFRRSLRAAWVDGRAALRWQ